MAIEILRNIPVAFKVASISVWGLLFILGLGMVVVKKTWGVLLRLPEKPGSREL